MVCWLVKEDKDIVVIYALLKSTILAQVFFFFFFFDHTACAPFKV